MAWSVYDLIPGSTAPATRAANCLWRADICTVADLLGCSGTDLMSLRAFGPVCLGIVRAALAEHGLTLKGEGS